MDWNLMFFVNSILLGVGLAMDAFSVSLANGLNEPLMKKRKMCGVACSFGAFQGIMPFIGWICINTVARFFTLFQKFIPWIALGLLVFIGVKMIIEGLRERQEERPMLGLGGLLAQSVATSIDALSVGFTLAKYKLLMALASSLIIMTVTFVLCLAGIALGKRFGTGFSGKATVIGGVILIVIGLEIFITGII